MGATFISYVEIFSLWIYVTAIVELIFLSKEFI